VREEGSVVSPHVCIAMRCEGKVEIFQVSDKRDIALSFLGEGFGWGREGGQRIHSMDTRLLHVKQGKQGVFLSGREQHDPGWSLMICYNISLDACTVHQAGRQVLTMTM
jgi:hypothetical protein